MNKDKCRTNSSSCHSLSGPHHIEIDKDFLVFFCYFIVGCCLSPLYIKKGEKVSRCMSSSNSILLFDLPVAILY